MSRYIIVPQQEGQNIFKLIPTEGLTDQIKEIELPEGIIPNIIDSKHIKSGGDLTDLMLKFSKSNIGRSKDGFITVENKVLEIKFDDFVVDCCNGEFRERYEHVYCLLRNCGITF